MFIMEEYDPNEDYKALHLEWLNKHKTFRPKGGIPIGYPTYMAYINELYALTIKENKTAYWYLKDDYKWAKNSLSIDEKVATLFGDKVEPEGDSYFITFNFPPDFIVPQSCLRELNKLFDKPYVSYGYAIFEFHGSNHNHPHIHMKLTVTKHKTPGKLRKKLLECSLAKYLTAPNFLDLKAFRPEHDIYLLYDKAVEKAPLLALDKAWRQENNLPEYVEKRV